MGLNKNKKMAGVYPFFVYIESVVFWGRLHIHQEMAYTSHFLILSRPKPGGGVYIWCPHLREANMGAKFHAEPRVKLM